MNKIEANHLLQYGLDIIYGKAFNSNYRSTLHLLLYIRNDLELHGFWRQARRLDYWIHRYQSNKNFLQQKYNLKRRVI